MVTKLTKREEALKVEWKRGEMTCGHCGGLRTIGHSFLMCLTCDTHRSITQFDRRLLGKLFPDRLQAHTASKKIEKRQKGPLPSQMDLFEGDDD